MLELGILCWKFFFLTRVEAAQWNNITSKANKSSCGIIHPSLTERKQTIFFSLFFDLSDSWTIEYFNCYTVNCFVNGDVLCFHIIWNLLYINFRFSLSLCLFFEKHRFYECILYVCEFDQLLNLSIDLTICTKFP